MDPLTLPARSWLFVPATRTDRIAKAAASGADRIIVDLEDAVAPSEKIAARLGLASATFPRDVPVYVRVNAASTEWFAGDVEAAASLPITGILLPKADVPQEVDRATARLPVSFHVVPIIETAVGFWNVLEVGRASHVERLVFGALDFQLDTGMHDADDAYAYVRSRITIASRVAGIGAPVDSVCLSINDEPVIAADAARGRHFGCCGKLCIHPNQVRVANQIFRPTDEEIEWAQSVLRERDARPADAVFSHRGALVDRPVIERAAQIVSLAAAIARPITQP
jgi:citrate lyase subunit beta/citryl-CoA lyase